MEALLIRAILESLRAAVTLQLPGTPQDFLEVLAQGELAPRYIVVSDRGGFLFGDYDRGIDTTMLVEGSLPADAIASRVHLPGKVVISTACETGTEVFGAAFTRGKVAAYVAPSGSPEGAIVPLFVHCLFHQLLQRKTPLDAALRRAQKPSTAKRACSCATAPRRRAGNRFGSESCRPVSAPHGAEDEDGDFVLCEQRAVR